MSEHDSNNEAQFHPLNSESQVEGWSPATVVQDEDEPLDQIATAASSSGEGQASALEELNRRLAVVRDRVRGVALGHHTGFYLFGRPGTGKTHIVRKTLAGLDIPYYYHDGHLTPLGLFDLLAEQHDRVIVLDDVSALFEERVALQLLLAALSRQPGGTEGRIVKYRRQGRVESVRFSGGIICLSNLELHAAPLLQALKSRMHYLKYDPTDEQLDALMQTIAAQGWPVGEPQLSPDECQEVAAFLIAASRRLGVRLDVRLLVDKAFPDYLQHRLGETEVHWKDLVIATLQEQLVDLQHTPVERHGRREGRKQQERQIIQELLAEYAAVPARLAAWETRTGKSARAYYRRLEELGREPE